VAKRSGIKLKDVAQAAGVSQGTASNVFSRPELVRQEVRERVQNVAKELGYAGPSLRGRLLRQGKVNAIGVATVEPLSYFFDDPYARALMAAISRVCDARGAGVALVSAQNQQRLAWNIQSALVDGFVLLCVGPSEPLVELTRRRNLPYVALALDVDDPEIPSIAIDDFGGAKAAAEHLLALGHRRFAVLAIELSESHSGLVSPDQARASIYASTRDRMLGYWTALAAAGIDERDVPVFETQADRESVEAGMATLFAGPDAPTALLAMSDRVALIALDWLAANGRRVPEDVSVVGFDGVPEGAKSVPALTTVAQPLERIAERAVGAIIDDVMPQGAESLPVSLVVRGSTAPARTGA
jgi:DNA-binding LacI/PurR family transcriptional regulator